MLINGEQRIDFLLSTGQDIDMGEFEISLHASGDCHVITNTMKIYIFDNPVKYQTTQGFR